MPSKAFVPAPLVEAEPRVYKSFRGRQLKGMLAAVAAAGLTLWMVGTGSFLGYALTFLAALPGFAYGYYQPQGKPVEYWARVLVGYYLRPQHLTPGQAPGRLQALRTSLRHAWRTCRYLVIRRKERKHLG